MKTFSFDLSSVTPDFIHQCRMKLLFLPGSRFTEALQHFVKLRQKTNEVEVLGTVSPNNREEYFYGGGGGGVMSESLINNLIKPLWIYDGYVLPNRAALGLNLSYCSLKPTQI